MHVQNACRSRFSGVYLVFQYGSGTEPEPETGTVGTFFLPETESANRNRRNGFPRTEPGTGTVLSCQSVPKHRETLGGFKKALLQNPREMIRGRILSAMIRIRARKSELRPESRSHGPKV